MPFPERLPHLAVAFAVLVFAAMALSACDPSASTDGPPGPDPEPVVGPEWYALVQGTDQDFVNAVVELPGGDVVVGGNATGSAAVGSAGGEATAVAGGDGDGFVARLAPDGSVRWARPIATGPGYGVVLDVAAVPGGFVVGGRFSGTATFGATTASSSATGDAGFVARLADDGTVVWVRVVQSRSTAAVYELAADPSGAVTVGGPYRDDVSVGGVSRPAAGGGTDAWFARIAPDGSVTWLQTFGGPNSDGVNAVAVAPGGEAFVVGNFAGQATVAGQALTSAGGRDGVALRVDPDGTVQWVRTASGAGPNDYFTGAGASAGGVAFSGLASGPVSVGGQTTAGAGMFAVGVTSAGDVRWLTSYAEAGACSASMDAAGGLLVGGGYSSASALGGRVGGRLRGGTDGYIARFTPTGELDWVRTQGGPDDDVVCITAPGAAHAYGGGWFGFEAALDGDAWPVAGRGSLDGFVVRYRLATAAS